MENKNWRIAFLEEVSNKGFNYVTEGNVEITFHKERPTYNDSYKEFCGGKATTDLQTELDFIIDDINECGDTNNLEKLIKLAKKDWQKQMYEEMLEQGFYEIRTELALDYYGLEFLLFKKDGNQRRTESIQSFMRFFNMDSEYSDRIKPISRLIEELKDGKAQEVDNFDKSLELLSNVEDHLDGAYRSIWELFQIQEKDKIIREAINSQSLSSSFDEMEENIQSLLNMIFDLTYAISLTGLMEILDKKNKKVAGGLK